MQRLKTLPVTVIAADTSDSDADPVTGMVDLVSAAAADDSTQAELPAAGDASDQGSSAVGPLTEHCLAADVLDKMVQLQQEHKFALATHCQRAHLSLDGSLSLVYYCNRGPKEEQIFIRQYIPLGDLARRRSTAVCKQACHSAVVLSSRQRTSQMPCHRQAVGCRKQSANGIATATAVRAAAANSAAATAPATAGSSSSQHSSSSSRHSSSSQSSRSQHSSTWTDWWLWS